MSGRYLTLKDYVERRFSEFTPELSCASRTREEFEEWKPRFLKRLREAIGVPPESVPLNPETTLVVSLPDGRAEKIVFDSSRWMSVTAWMLVPDGLEEGERRPAVVLIPGHTGDNLPGGGRIVDGTSGKAWAVGLNPDGSPCSTRYHNNVGQELLRAGFIVYCPDMLGFGERASHSGWARNRWNHICNLHALAFQYFGDTSLPAVHLHDLQRGLDYVSGRPEVDPVRIGVTGCSLGGMWSMFLAALDERVEAAAVSNSYPNYRARMVEKKLGICGSFVLKGEARLGGGADLLSAIAPKPLFIQLASRDPGMALEDARKPVDQACSVYDMLGYADRFRVHVFDGEHEIAPGPVVGWLRDWL